MLFSRGHSLKTWSRELTVAVFFSIYKLLWGHLSGVHEENWHFYNYLSTFQSDWSDWVLKLATLWSPSQVPTIWATAAPRIAKSSIYWILQLLLVSDEHCRGPLLALSIFSGQGLFVCHSTTPGHTIKWRLSPFMLHKINITVQSYLDISMSPKNLCMCTTMLDIGPYQYWGMVFYNRARGFL